jgi:hypothetical protein
MAHDTNPLMGYVLNKANSIIKGWNFKGKTNSGSERKRSSFLFRTFCWKSAHFPEIK